MSRIESSLRCSAQIKSLPEFVRAEYVAAADRIAELEATITRHEESTRLAEAHITLTLTQLAEAQAECARLRAFVADLAEHGTRFDLNPCLDHTPENVASEYLRYIRRIDDSVRDLSKAALRGKEAP